MRGLLDVNALIAFLDPEHIHHAPIQSWFAANRDTGWATCPITQNGFLRIVSQPRYERPMPVATAFAGLNAAVGVASHAFWPDSVSFAEPGLVDIKRILGPKQITDIYLLALAVKNGGRLVTFDAGVPLAAVQGANADNLVRL